MTQEPLDPIVASDMRRDCAVCGGSPGGVQPAPGLFQIRCRTGKHRTRYYPTREGAIDAWNLHQRKRLLASRSRT